MKLLNQYDVDEMTPEDVEFIMRWAAIAGAGLALVSSAMLVLAVVELVRRLA
jgi:hypothetical protein